MKPALTFTYDLEDHRPHDGLPKRYDAITDRLLTFLDERQIKGTIFTVGALAEKDPAIVKVAHAAGHEIAHHSYEHTVLIEQTPEAFRDHTKRAKDILEDITGAAVKGYRAPVFSLTRETLWAVDVLKELGFEYSSSVLPASNPLHGFPDAPRVPFLWPNGLREIPAPLGRIGPKAMPYLGGFYLRYIPSGIIARLMAKAANDEALWTYCHPYDFDAEEKNWRIKGASVPASLLLRFNRKNTFRKLDRLLSACAVLPPFQDQSFGNDLPLFDPVT